MWTDVCRPFLQSASVRESNRYRYYFSSSLSNKYLGHSPK